jgi:hypothetical protein
MDIIFGTMLAGEVDRVPGLFSVKTKFGHLMYFPLLPLQAYLVIEGSDKFRAIPAILGFSQFQGVPIKASPKSTVVGWLRGLVAVVGVGVVFWFCRLISDVMDNKLPASVAAIRIALFLLPYAVVAGLLLRPLKASHQRALELAAIIALAPAVVNKVYEQSLHSPSKEKEHA